MLCSELTMVILAKIQYNTKLLLWQGSEIPNDYGMIEKVGMSISTTVEGITIIEVVQTRRAVDTGALDIWISQSSSVIDNMTESFCVEHQEGSGNETWKATVVDYYGDAVTSEVTNALQHFNPQPAEVQYKLYMYFI
ncbi:hypothetical protein EB796_019821 [Bugula neritina]|uniref:Uncharacterized protein n=1 Tax=Bugula neritina TaxID=10212 RepID=A0A7J7J6U1_BUGNE|nr:hypothetical protein EB796_019821 [Bugula neritina]